MNANSASRKLLSLIFIIGGIAMLVVSLIMDFSGSGVPYRGALLVCGIIALILGLYLFPTLKYHRRIIIKQIQFTEDLDIAQVLDYYYGKDI